MASSDDIMTLGVEVESKQAIKEFDRIQKALNSRMKSIDKHSEKLGKVTGKLWKGMGAGVRKTYIKSITDAQRIQEKSEKNLRRLTNQRAVIQKTAMGLNKKQEDILGKIREAERTGNKDSIKGLKEQQAALNNMVQAQKDVWSSLGKEADDYQKVLDDTSKHIADVKERIETDLVGEYNIRELAEGLKDGGDYLQAPLRAFMSNDFPEAAESAAKVVGSTLIQGFRLGARFFRQPKRTPGGQDPKVSKLSAAFDKVATTLTKLQPLFGAIGAGLKDIMKTWLEINARVKDFNKSLIASASTSEILYKHGMNATAAFEDIHKSLEGIYQSAHSLDNLKWGIKPDEHIAVINALTAEGYSLQKMKENAEKAGKSIGDFTADLVHSQVAYSRNFGVSLQEITTLSGDMISEVGVRAEKTTEKLQMISDAANESGLGATKFFNIIRSMSANMSLFNNRMEDSVRILKAIGKVMSPQEAQRYMQTLQGFFKGQDLQSRIKMTLLAGGEKEVGGVLQRDTNRILKDMSRDLGLNGQQMMDMKDAVTKSPEDTVKWMAKNRKLSSTQRSAALDAAIMQAKLNKGDLVDVASAVKDASPAASREILEKIAQNMFGQPIDKLSGVNRLAFANLTGFSDEMLDQQKKANLGVMQTKEDLVEALKHNEEISDEQKALLKNLGVQGDNAAMAAELEKKSTDDVWRGLTGLQQKQLKGTDESKDYDKEALEHQKAIEEHMKATMQATQNIAGDTTSIVQKLEGVKNWLESTLVKHLGEGGAAAVEAGGKTVATVGAGILAGKAILSSITSAISAGVAGAGAAGAGAGAGAAGAAAGAAGAGAAGAAGAGAAGAAGAAGVAGVAGAGLAATAGAGLAAAGGVYAAYDQLMKLTDEIEATGGLAETWKLLTEGPAKALSPEEYDKLHPPTATTTTATKPELKAAPGAEKPPSTVEEIKQQIDVVKQQAKDITAIVQATRDLRPSIDGLKDTFGSHALVTEEQGTATQVDIQDGFSNLADILKRRVKLDKTFVTSELGKQMETSVLNAARQALLEYALIKDMAPGDLRKAVQDPNFNPATFLQTNLQAVQAETGGPNAAGGSILGRNPDGTAKVIRPPAGEMPAFVGPGEAIAARGGGGGGMNVSVSVNGIGGNDLAQMVKVAATNAIYEYKRRENLH